MEPRSNIEGVQAKFYFTYVIFNDRILQYNLKLYIDLQTERHAALTLCPQPGSSDVK